MTNVYPWIDLAYRFLAPHTLAFAAAAVLGSMSIMWLFGPALATLQEVVPQRLRVTSVAFFLLCVQLLGYAPDSALAGWLADQFTAAGITDPLTWALVLAGSPGLLAAPLFWAAYRCYQIDAQRLAASTPTPPVAVSNTASTESPAMSTTRP